MKTPPGCATRGITSVKSTHAGELVRRLEIRNILARSNPVHSAAAASGKKGGRESRSEPNDS